MITGTTFLDSGASRNFISNEISCANKKNIQKKKFKVELANCRDYEIKESYFQKTKIKDYTDNLYFHKLLSKEM